MPPIGTRLVVDIPGRHVEGMGRKLGFGSACTALMVRGRAFQVVFGSDFGSVGTQPSGIVV